MSKVEPINNEPMVVDHDCFGTLETDDRHTYIYLDKYNPIELKNLIVSQAEDSAKFQEFHAEMAVYLDINDIPWDGGNYDIQEIVQMLKNYVNMMKNINEGKSIFYAKVDYDHFKKQEMRELVKDASFTYHCNSCGMLGVPKEDNRKCGNCFSTDTFKVIRYTNLMEDIENVK